MKALERWIASERKRQLRTPRLEDALFGNRSAQYVAFRLRFVTLRVVLRTVLHIVEVVALSRVFPARYLGPILLLRHASLLLSSLHWGALEAQRNALRAAHRRRDAAAFVNVARQWSAATLTTMLVAQGLVASIIAVTTSHQHGFSIYHAYGLACGLRVAMDAWARTRQSMVFAVARVRRTFSSMVLTDLADVLGLILAWLAIRAYAFALVLVLSGVVRLVLTLHFTNATRAHFELPAWRDTTLRDWRSGAWLRLPWRTALKSALFNAALQVESLAIACLATGLAGEAGFILSLSLHALSPLLGTGVAWTRVVYFDFVRLRRFHGTFLVERFGRLLDRVAIVYPIVLVVLVLPLVDWLAPHVLVTATPMLSAFVVARSLFALRQMEAYSYADHTVQLRQAVVLMCVVGAIAWTQPDLSLLFVYFSLGCVVAAVASGRARPAAPSPLPGNTTWTETFLAWLARQDQPLWIAKLQWNPALTTALRVRRGLVASGFTSPVWVTGARQLTIAVSGELDAAAVRRRVISATAGTLQNLELSASPAMGAQVCVALARDLSRAHGDVRAIIDPVPARVGHGRFDLATAIRDFERAFPDGICLTPSRGSVRPLGEAARTEVRQLLQQFADRDLPKRKRFSTVEVAAYRPSGDVKALFLLSRQSSRLAAFSAWRSELRHASIRDTLASIAVCPNGARHRTAGNLFERKCPVLARAFAAFDDE